MNDDPLDSLLDLEEDYYREGYLLGETDGAHAGYVEGKLFGIEKGYEKALEMGRMHGRALVWKYRLGLSVTNSSEPTEISTSDAGISEVIRAVDGLPKLPDNSRLIAHVDQLLFLTDPRNYSDGNDDDSVADFDERLKKATAKTKIISRIVGELEKPTEDKATQKQGDGSGNIEDLSSLSARH